MFVTVAYKILMLTNPPQFTHCNKQTTPTTIDLLTKFLQNSLNLKSINYYVSGEYFLFLETFYFNYRIVLVNQIVCMLQYFYLVLQLPAIPHFGTYRVAANIQMKGIAVFICLFNISLSKRTHYKYTYILNVIMIQPVKVKMDQSKYFIRNI